MGIRFGQGIQVVNILAPADIVATATKTSIFDLKGANWATLALHFGAITCDPPTITVKCSTAATTTSAIAVAFQYRLSTLPTIDGGTMGAITQATTTGVALTGGAADNGKMLIIDVDPAAIAAEGADYRYLHALITPSADATATMVGAVAYLEPRYPGNSIPVTVTT
jgi:hypothetical protein